ncbi:hypothetical protein [Sulfitobacter phage vB_SupP_AX]|nr:hypothetical protein [Sulfitobacter phage vB_SupP_AX]
MPNPNLIHSMDAAHCNKIMRRGESHFPELKSQEEIDAEMDADASDSLFSRLFQSRTAVSKRLRRFWE